MKTDLTVAKRAWFAFTLCSDIAIIWIILKVLNNLPDFIINPERKRELSSLVCAVLGRLIFYLNPQINIKSLNNWHLPDKGPFVILINHTSPLDSFFFSYMFPLKYAPKVRTLSKAELFQIPIFGDLLTYCGHFPVHFMSSKSNSFSVDKEKQAKVIEDIKAHISNGGILAFFPEGQLNPADTRKLQPFRAGLFKIFSELAISSRGINKINMYAFLHAGLENVWHPKSRFGGASATVNCKSSPLLFSNGAHVNEIQHVVQQELDSVPHPAPAVYARNVSAKL